MIYSIHIWKIHWLQCNDGDALKIEEFSYPFLLFLFFLLLLLLRHLFFRSFYVTPALHFCAPWTIVCVISDYPLKYRDVHCTYSLARTHTHPSFHLVRVPRIYKVYFCTRILYAMISIFFERSYCLYPSWYAGYVFVRLLYIRIRMLTLYASIVSCLHLAMWRCTCVHLRKRKMQNTEILRMRHEDRRANSIWRDTQTPSPPLSYQRTPHYTHWLNGVATTESETTTRGISTSVTSHQHYESMAKSNKNKKIRNAKPSYE